jgi:hypothetical protein
VAIVSARPHYGVPFDCEVRSMSSRRGDGRSKREKPRVDDYPGVLPEDSRTDFALEAAAAVTSILPGLGGAIANVLSGWSAERKRERVREVLEGFALRLANLQSRLSDDYVRSDEFEDILDQALRHAAFEWSRDKRRMLREFLVGVARQQGSYDEQLRLLRALDVLQSSHIGLLSRRRGSRRFFLSHGRKFLASNAQTTPAPNVREHD